MAGLSFSGTLSVHRQPAGCGSFLNWLRMRKKTSKRLGVGEPLFFVNSADPKIDKRLSLELIDLSIGVDRVMWVARTGSGEIIEGRHLTSVRIPFLADGVMCLSIPIKLHLRGKSLAPEFVFEIPGAFLIVSDISEIQ